jgi:hypothetical protein
MAQYEPFEVQQAKLNRMYEEAQALRSRRQQQPEGKMVGKRFVPPHWTQQLAPLIDSFMASSKQYTADQQAAQLGQQMQTGAADWMSSRPQNQQVEVPGPQPEEMQGVPVSRTQEPTQQERLEWAQRGTNNPLTKALAAAYGADVLLKEPERQENRQWRSEESAANRAAALAAKQEQAQARLQELTLRLEDRGLDRGSREAMAKEADATRRYIAELMADARRYAADARADAAGSRGSDKPVPNKIMETLRQGEQTMSALDRMNAGFDDKYGGPQGAVDKLSGTWNPFSGKESEATANWWKDYENQAALVERHGLFGSALSANELAAWRTATVQPGMKAETIRHNLAKRAEIARKHYRDTREQYIKGGYGKVDEAFPDVPDTTPTAAPTGSVTVPPTVRVIKVR